MCGIFAYSGSRSVPDILIEGLKKLEYRGYDSSGLAFFHQNHIKHFRVCGGVSKLENLLDQNSYKGHLGIGHTRWATHGSPSKENAHPHKASSIYVVHNGVIENESELRRKVDSSLLTSETDTELIAHLISNFYEKERPDLLKSVLKVTELLKGSYAVVALCEEKPEELIAFKKGPPLMLCKGKGDYFISSDPYVSGEYSNQVLFLDDEEVLYLKKDQFEVFNFQGKKIKKEFETVDYNQSLSEKKGYPHFMLKEIFEQPHCISRALSSYLDKDKQTLNLKVSKGSQKDFDALFEKNSQILIVACGSSYYAGLFAKYIIESIVPIRVDVEMASEFIYRKSFIPKGTPVLSISQSGETADILTALKQVEERGLESISLCNVKGSTLDRKTKYSLYMEAGKEVGVASTKTFSSSLVVLSLLGMHISKIKKHLPVDKEKEWIKDLLSLPAYMKEVLNCDKFFMETVETFKKFSGFFYVGRGLYYPIALEGALKLKEIAYLHAEAYPSGEMKHGPLAMIDENIVAVVLLPSGGKLYEKTLTNLKEIKARGAYIIGLGGASKEEELEKLASSQFAEKNGSNQITEKNGSNNNTMGELEKLCDHQMVLPKINHLFHPILSLIPLQMMAYSISRSYGYDADRPRNLAKSVTVE